MSNGYGSRRQQNGDWKFHPANSAVAVGGNVAGVCQLLLLGQPQGVYVQGRWASAQYNTAGKLFSFHLSTQYRLVLNVDVMFTSSNALPGS